MEPQVNTRARLVFALVAGVALVAVIVIVAAGSGSGNEGDAAAAPPECVDAWNDDPAAVSIGQHQAVGHGYSRVQIAYSSEDGSEIGPDPISGGGCVVVFAATRLDPEQIAAAQINLGKQWEPLSQYADPTRLGELQSGARAAANATIAQDGTVEASSS